MNGVKSRKQLNDCWNTLKATTKLLIVVYVVLIMNLFKLPTLLMRDVNYLKLLTMTVGTIWYQSFWGSAVSESGLQCGNEKEVDLYENQFGYSGYCGFDLFPTIASNSFQNTLISNWNSDPQNDYWDYNPFLAQCEENT